jgi:hypothetical protein
MQLIYDPLLMVFVFGHRLWWLICNTFVIASSSLLSPRHPIDSETRQMARCLAACCSDDALSEELAHCYYELFK